MRNLFDKSNLKNVKFLYGSSEPNVCCGLLDRDRPRMGAEHRFACFCGMGRKVPDENSLKIFLIV